MDQSLLRELETISYGDLVRASWRRLVELRQELQSSCNSAIVAPGFPTHVQVQTIAGCNADCPMCPMSDRRMRKLQKGRMPMELFRKIVEEAARYEECAVISPYLQNEPLLDPLLPARISAIKKISGGRLSARIVTNGFLLDERRLTALIEAGIDVISVSLNAHTPETYHTVMGGLELDTTLANIERLLVAARDRVMVLLTFMVTRQNEAEIAEAVTYWSSRGVLCGGFNIGTMTGNVPNFEDLKPRMAIERPLECFVPLEATSILANGDMLLCCSDWARHSVYGNVWVQTIYEIWHSLPLAEVRREAILGRFGHRVCQRCLGQTKSPANLAFESAGESLALQRASRDA